MEFVALATQVIQYGISVLMGGSQPQSAGPPPEDPEGICTALMAAVDQHEGGGDQPMAFPLDWKSIVTLLLTLVQTVVSSL